MHIQKHSVLTNFLDFLWKQKKFITWIYSKDHEDHFLQDLRLINGSNFISWNFALFTENIKFQEMFWNSNYWELFGHWHTLVSIDQVIYIRAGWSKIKFMKWSRGKVFEKFSNKFLRSLSLYILTSSQEVRAFVM